MLYIVNLILFFHVLFGKKYFIVSSVNHMSLYLCYTVSKCKDIVFVPPLTIIHTDVTKMYSHRFQCYIVFILYKHKYLYTHFGFIQHLSLLIQKKFWTFSLFKYFNSLNKTQSHITVCIYIKGVGTGLLGKLPRPSLYLSNTSALSERKQIFVIFF